MDRDFGPRFSMGELEEATGLRARTIRYYIGEGLAPPAAGRGRSSYYTSAHVETLAKIRELRNRNLSHNEIRETLVPAPVEPDVATGERWSRILLHPDVELHLREEAPEHIQALVREIQATVHRWLGTDPEE